MTKRTTLLLLLCIVVATTWAQTPRMLMSKMNQDAGNHLQRAQKMQPKARLVSPKDFTGITFSTLLTEDFSKFTAGSEQTPDGTRLDDDNLVIDDSYFNTPGWGGLEVYQAGGCAFLDLSEAYQATGLLISPTLDLSGFVRITFRARSVDAEGDYVDYNILDAASNEVIDGNYFFVGNEWTDVEFVTSYGTTASYLYFFSEYSQIFIDDIKVESAKLETPVLNAETGVSEQGFTASWGAVDGAELYDVYATAHHAVGADGVCLLADFNFDNMRSGGTEDDPEYDYENIVVALHKVCPSDFPGWTLVAPAYAPGVAAVTGRYVDINTYGSLSSPEMDLSQNDGEMTLSLRIKAKADEPVVYRVLTLNDEGYQYSKEVNDTTNGEWQEVEVMLTGGGKRSHVQIVYGGSHVLLIDDVKLTQQLPEGTVSSHRFLDETTAKTSIDIQVPQRYYGDKVTYTVRAVKEIWEELDGETFLIDAIESPFSEPREVTLVTAIERAPQLNKRNSQIFDLQGRRVINAQRANRGIYIVDGKKVMF